MTEAEWLKSTDVEKMVSLLRRTRSAGPRKYRLFGCACCRSIWDRLDDTARLGVETAERRADGAITEDEFRAISDRVRVAMEASTELRTVYRAVVAALGPDMAAGPVLDLARLVGIDAHRTTGTYATRLAQPGMLRDLFGPLPFRPVVFPPAWLSSTVVALATGIYDDRAFDRMPILADALQDAGCDNEDVLGHLRGSGPHVRGCWVVDRLLGKV